MTGSLDGSSVSARRRPGAKEVAAGEALAHERELEDGERSLIHGGVRQERGEGRAGRARVAGRPETAGSPTRK